MWLELYFVMDHQEFDLYNESQIQLILTEIRAKVG